MSEVQRWNINHVLGRVYIDEKSEGGWVTYADHLAAVKELQAAFYTAYQQQKADHLAAVAAAMEEAVRDYATAHHAAMRRQYSDGVKAARDEFEILVHHLWELGAIDLRTRTTMLEVGKRRFDALEKP